MLPNEPLQFIPVFRSYLWGGNRLKARLNKSVPDNGRWAESWEIVDHGEDQSIVQSGPWKDWTLRQLIESFPQEILGTRAASEFKVFPLLLKYLDCNSVLSVQVHPEDSYALRMETPDFGKTEAWYIVDRDEDAKLYAGLIDGVTREDLEVAIKFGRTEECLHVITPEPGDCVFIPAGTVHALGSGLIVAEIQQASDTTFRLYDWNRVDADGNSRPLHIEQALEVIDFRKGPIVLQSARECTTKGHIVGNMTVLVECDKFQLVRFGAGEIRLARNDTFYILTVPTGNAVLSWASGSHNLSTGDSVLVPADAADCTLQIGAGSTVLYASLPDVSR